jgi:hypothetical protein
MDVLEHENRLCEEIRRKATLGSVAELHRWEKRIAEGGEGPPGESDEKKPGAR